MDRKSTGVLPCPSRVCLVRLHVRLVEHDLLGGEARVSRSVKVITENYIWKDGHGIVSAGVRFFGERLSADLALAVPIGADGVYTFPLINFVYVF